MEGFSSVHMVYNHNMEGFFIVHVVHHHYMEGYPTVPFISLFLTESYCAMTKVKEVVNIRRTAVTLSV